jgi:integrase
MGEARAREGRGLLPLTGQSTVERFLGDWLEQEVRPNRAPWTCDEYASSSRCHFVPALGKLRVDQVTPAVVQAFVQGLRDKGLAQGTVHKLKKQLTTAFGWGVRMKLVAENPVSPVRTQPAPPRVEAGAMMTEAEVTAFCAAIRGHRDEAIYLLGLLLGLRRGEVLGLSWDHIDLQEAEARVVQQAQRQTGRGIVIKPLKTGRRGARTVPLPRRLVEALWARRTAETLDRERNWHKWRTDLDGDKLVFRSRHGTPLEPKTLRDGFVRVLARLELPPRRFHDLRHNCATILFGQGVSAKLVQELLGHSSLGMTMDIYTHVPRGAMREAIGGLERLLED